MRSTRRIAESSGDEVSVAATRIQARIRSSFAARLLKEKLAEEKKKARDWVERKSNDGKVYYWNSRTRTSTWFKPSCLQSPEEKLNSAGSNWAELQAEDGSTYFHNVKTGTCSWEEPPQLTKVRSLLKGVRRTVVQQQEEAAATDALDNLSKDALDDCTIADDSSRTGQRKRASFREHNDAEHSCDSDEPPMAPAESPAPLHDAEQDEPQPFAQVRSLGCGRTRGMEDDIGPQDALDHGGGSEKSGCHSSTDLNRTGMRKRAVLGRNGTIYSLDSDSDASQQQRDSVSSWQTVPSTPCSPRVGCAAGVALGGGAGAALPALALPLRSSAAEAPSQRAPPALEVSPSEDSPGDRFGWLSSAPARPQKDREHASDYTANGKADSRAYACSQTDGPTPDGAQEALSDALQRREAAENFAKAEAAVTKSLRQELAEMRAQLAEQDTCKRRRLEDAKREEEEQKLYLQQEVSEAVASVSAGLKAQNRRVEDVRELFATETLDMENLMTDLQHSEQALAERLERSCAVSAQLQDQNKRVEDVRELFATQTLHMEKLMIALQQSEEALAQRLTQLPDDTNCSEPGRSGGAAAQRENLPNCSEPGGGSEAAKKDQEIIEMRLELERACARDELQEVHIESLRSELAHQRRQWQSELLQQRAAAASERARLEEAAQEAAQMLEHTRKREQEARAPWMKTAQQQHEAELRSERAALESTRLELQTHRAQLAAAREEASRLSASCSDDRYFPGSLAKREQACPMARQHAAPLQTAILQCQDDWEKPYFQGCSAASWRSFDAGEDFESSVAASSSVGEERGVSDVLPVPVRSQDIAPPPHAGRLLQAGSLSRSLGAAAPSESGSLHSSSTRSTLPGQLVIHRSSAKKPAAWLNF
eukprot:TRINITY_DN57815_c0_g1_i2.p1 TRINITY_DN57815_c0_g1~~TRINITY_DN57815_c0_g1_i2.p1  ORF type:complete len:882 (-),score=222.14 TRINITY_DN57815_c0_g1_i2:628-3273(-)